MKAASSTLMATRAALYPYTRPLFAAVGIGTAAIADGALGSPFASSRTALAAPADSFEEQAALLPVAAVGLVGVAAVLRGHAGLIWMSHSYERWAWVTAFGCLPVAVAATAVNHQRKTATDAEELRFLLAPSVGAALAAVAGERLGSAVGRVLLPTLTGIGALSAGAAFFGDERGKRVASDLQSAALILMPALHAVCLPVYTLSAHTVLGIAWFHAAAAWSTLDDAPKAVQRVLLAVGAASVLRCLCRRAPICHF